MAGHTQRGLRTESGRAPHPPIGSGGGHRGRGQGGQRRRRHGAGVWDLATGKEVARWTGDHAVIACTVYPPAFQDCRGTATRPYLLKLRGRSTPPDQSQSPCPPPSSSAGRAILALYQPGTSPDWCSYSSSPRSSPGVCSPCCKSNDFQTPARTDPDPGFRQVSTARKTC